MTYYRPGVRRTAEGHAIRMIGGQIRRRSIHSEECARRAWFLGRVACPRWPIRRYSWSARGTLMLGHGLGGQIHPYELLELR